MNEPALDATLRRIAAETTLFAASPSRLALARLDLAAEGAAGRVVRVSRNHAIEPVMASMAPFLAYAGLAIDFRVGDYDDSLASFADGPADLDLIYLDLDRYVSRLAEEETDEWLADRVESIRTRSVSPIVVATFVAPDRASRLEARLARVPDAHLANLVEATGEAWSDERTASVSGTRLRGALHPLVARELALRVLPASLLPPRKAVVLDLDETLYRGVLGEDGPLGVELTDAHRALHESLVALRGRGVFLAVVTKNDPRDVDALFAARTDFPLSRSHLSSVRAGWGDKSSAIAAVATDLRIGHDAILFVDDNPGELVSVAEALPSIRLLRADADASITTRGLHFHPGLMRRRVGADDALRVDDLAANEARREMSERHLDPDAYLRSLDVHVRITVDAPDDVARLAELCRKTNQFNLALGRTVEAEIERRRRGGLTSGIAVGLADRLSDSGTVAAILLSREAGTLVVDELCVSCRALGRRIEDALVLAPILAHPLAEGATQLAFRVAHGERNEPALLWLAGLLGRDSPPAPGLQSLAMTAVRAHPLPTSVHYDPGMTTR